MSQISSNTVLIIDISQTCPRSQQVHYESVIALSQTCPRSQQIHYESLTSLSQQKKPYLILLVSHIYLSSNGPSSKIVKTLRQELKGPVIVLHLSYQE